MSNKQLWLVLGAGSLIVFVAMGTRQSFGIFLAPVTGDLGAGRELFSLAVALQNIMISHSFCKKQ